MATQRKLFCELSPTCYKISVKKEILRRHTKNIKSGAKFAEKKEFSPLANLVSEHNSYMIKKGPGIDPVLQRNKVINIDLASSKINGILIPPGEEFSFWHTVGKVSKKNGYKDGRVIINQKILAGIGGGLCNLANTLHLLILHSPLTVTEFHSHSDALAPDEGERVPFSAGTSVEYNYVDYRFRNDTEQTMQLLFRCEDDILYAQLRSEHEIPCRYELSEEGHHFEKQGEKYYRISKIYKNTFDKQTNELINKELVLDNHSEVMFDYNLIPQELISQKSK